MELRFAAQFLVQLINAIERARWVLNAEKKVVVTNQAQPATTSDTGGCCGQSTRPQSRTKMARMHVDSCRAYARECCSSAPHGASHERSPRQPLDIAKSVRFIALRL